MPVDVYATAASSVFDEMVARDGSHNAIAEFVHLLEDNTIDIDQAPIGDYGYNESDGVVHDHSEEEDGVKEIDKAMYDQEQAKKVIGKSSSRFIAVGMLSWKKFGMHHQMAPLNLTMYNDMEASCGRSFNLEHCWNLLQHRQKWKLLEKESPPKRGSLTEMDDDDEDDYGPRNKNKPDGNKKAKDKIKRKSEASSLRYKIDIMVQSNKVLVIKTLKTKKELAEKKAQEKQERWLLLKEEGMRKAVTEERKALAKENKALVKLLAEENKIMVMNRNEMDDITKE
ncbi:Lactation elevated protein 1 [Hordeum vulgare]|nr:Lactation elevated protein 1 [Hordeum vulgare]